MKIATTTGDFTRFCKDDIEIITELHRAGFKYIDLSMYTFTPDCVYMQDGWQEEVKRLKAAADKLGMEFVQAHSQGGNPLNPDETDFIVAATIRSIEICQMLGIKNTVVHSGVGDGLTKKEWFKVNKEFYDKMLPTAKKCGVNILCENATKANFGDRYFINTGKDMREFIEYVNHPNFHGCWDTGHGNCEGAQYDEIMTLGEHLYGIHFNDNHGTKDEHIVPFLGTLSLDEIMHAIIDVGFKGPFDLECGNTLLGGGWRRDYDKDDRLRMPTLFMQRHVEKMMYEIAEYIVNAYNL